MKKRIFAIFLILALLVPTVSFAQEKSVCLGGQTVGIAFYTEGLLVSDFSAFEDEAGKITCPAKDGGIKKGDYLLSANGIALDDRSNIDAILSASNEKIEFEIIRNEEKKNVTVVPQISGEDNQKHLGVFLRESAAGIGTITFSDQEQNFYYALGHGINDETNLPLHLKTGRIVNCNVSSVVKGERGKTGELHGTFGTSATVLGEIAKNTVVGICGKTNEKFEHGQSIALGTKEDVHDGDAQICCSVDGEKKMYNIEILSLNYNTNKNMVIRITDEELLEKTGGIVQGMSGSPIVQDGKLIGAVTHVLVDDPTCGYGIFAENMIKTSNA